MVNSRNVPPLVEGYEAIVVHIDLVEEASQSPHGNRQSGKVESSPEFLLVKAAVLVPIDRPEELKELVLGGLNEDSKFWGVCLAPNSCNSSSQQE